MQLSRYCGQQINDDTQRYHRNFVGLSLCETCRSERAYRSKKVGRAKVEQHVWLAEYLVSKYPLTAKQMALILRVRDAKLKTVLQILREGLEYIKKCVKRNLDEG